MTRYVLRRAFHSVGVALTVLVLVFFVGRMIGDPAVLILPVDARAEQVEELRERLGLNAPLSTQHNFSPLSLGQYAEILVYLSGSRYQLWVWY